MKHASMFMHVLVFVSSYMCLNLNLSLSLFPLTNTHTCTHTRTDVEVLTMSSVQALNVVFVDVSVNVLYPTMDQHVSVTEMMILVPGMPRVYNAMVSQVKFE